MIYTRWGSEFEIEAAQKDVWVSHLPAPVTLVRSENGLYRFAEFLKADNGSNEISQAVEEATPLELTGEELIEAIREAS